MDNYGDQSQNNSDTAADRPADSGSNAESEPLSDDQRSQMSGAGKNPFEPVESAFDRFETMLGMVAAQPQDVIDTLVTDTLSIPPEKRFDTAAGVLEARLDDELGEFAALGGLTAIEGGAVTELLGSELPQIAEAVAGGYAGEHTVERAVILAAINAALVATERSPTDSRQAASAALAVSCRLYRAARVASDDGPESVDLAALATDTVRAYRTAATATETTSGIPVPETPKGAIQTARRIGATEWYRRGERTTAAAAQMAGVPEPAFDRLVASLTDE